ncbi:MAG: diacylglycerol kinase family lipid kinase [Deltaproteobacteria bacterium]|jgi:YegS/Rv2252/BmrU family lipid kinase|nr:diacylglycerol kinase family lipid kinase [Deltaproteobacteria bacterium]
MRIMLIANPISGGGARAKIQEAARMLRESCAEVDLYVTQGSGDARHAASEAAAHGYDRLVVAGGDGTLNEVMNGIVPTDLPVAFLPMGTVNVFALETGIPFGLNQACQLAIHGRPRRVHLGKIDGQIFLLMASAGWDAEAVARLRPDLKRWIGRGAYVFAAFEALLAGPMPPIQVIFSSGETVSGYGVVASNCRYYGGRYVVTPSASIFDDTLQVCVFRQPGRLAWLRIALNLALKRALRPPAVSFHRAKSLHVIGDDVSVQVDGDVSGALPVTIDALPNAASIILPEMDQ